MTIGYTPSHGYVAETEAASRIGGPMFWHTAEWFTVGPFVWARKVESDGSTGQRVFMAMALDPVRYIRATAGETDYGAGL